MFDIIQFGDVDFSILKFQLLIESIILFNSCYYSANIYYKKYIPFQKLK